MQTRFIIEDELHAEHISEHSSLADAWTELKRLSSIPWDQAPNLAPCGSWQTCGRDYQIIEYEISSEHWHLVRRISGLTVSAAETVWDSDAPYSES
jgi:hypothetical protein